MRTKLSNNAEVYHVWAQRSQSSGDCGNCSFDGDVAYSYSAEIARFHGDTVLVSARTYSVTTSCHMGRARSAASHYPQLTVDNVSPRTKTDHRGNLDGLFARLRKLVGKQKRARKYDYRSQIRSTATLVSVYCQHFRCRSLLKKDERCIIDAPDHGFWAAVDLDHAETSSRLEKQRRRDAIVDRKRVAEQEASASKNLSAWRKGESLRHPMPSRLALRVNGDRVETTMRAEIPVSEARRVWPLIKSAHVNGGTLPETIARHYRPSGIDEDGTLRVGCHAVPYDEMEMIAELIGV